MALFVLDVEVDGGGGEAGAGDLQGSGCAVRYVVEVEVVGSETRAEMS